MATPAEGWGTDGDDGGRVGIGGGCSHRVTSPRSLSRPPLYRALATLVERGVAEGLGGAAYSKQPCGIARLSRRSDSDWEGEGNDRRSWDEVLPVRWAGAVDGGAACFGEG